MSLRPTYSSRQLAALIFNTEIVRLLGILSQSLVLSKPACPFLSSSLTPHDIGRHRAAGQQALPVSACDSHMICSIGPLEQAKKGNSPLASDYYMICLIGPLEQEKKEKSPLASEYVDNQKAVDSALTSAISAELKSYLSARCVLFLAPKFTAKAHISALDVCLPWDTHPAHILLYER